MGLLKRFIKIGKGTLIKALGIQQNYKIIDEQKQSFSDDCLKCYHYLLSDTTSCSSCPHYKTCKQSVYINEKNKYGYQHRLSGNALKLFLYYHFIGPDNNGIIKNISFSAVAEQLGCTTRTVENNHKQLIEYGYILSCSDANNEKSVMVLLTDYKKYYASARNGGSGYLTISNDLFEELLAIKDVNSLRLTLRAILNCDNKQNKMFVNKNYTELKRYLPRYFNRHLIQKALENNNVLDIQVDDSKVLFLIKDKYNGKEVREKTLFQNKEEIRRYIDRINEYFSHYNNNPTVFSQLLMAEDINFEVEKINIPIVLECSEKDLDDLSLISLDSGLSELLDVITYIYQYYVILHDKIKSIGALARSTLNDIKRITA